MQKSICLCLVFIAFVQAGCGPSASSVLEKYRDEYAKKREQLRSIAGALPANAYDEPKACQKIEPKILFNKAASQSNTEVIMYEQLRDPNAKPQFDLMMDSALLLGIHWTDPSSSSSAASGGDPDYMEKTLKAGLDARYLIVNRVYNFKEPVAVDDETFTRGHVAFNSYVVDLSNNQMICGFPVFGESSSNVEYTAKSNESGKARLQAFARSSMWEAARRAFALRLSQMTGADVALQ